LRGVFCSRTPGWSEVIDADPVADYVREIMAKRTAWEGSASDLLEAGAASALSSGGAGWPKNPRAVAGRLRRAQTYLRTIGIQIAFTREGRAGSRIIKITVSSEDRSNRSSKTKASSAATVQHANDADGADATFDPEAGQFRSANPYTRA
jgi:hypothetical protein